MPRTAGQDKPSRLHSALAQVQVRAQLVWSSPMHLLCHGMPHKQAHGAIMVAVHMGAALLVRR